MPSFGNTSIERLLTCHVLIQQILNKAIEKIDFCVVCGHRGKKEQDDCFKSGASKLKFPLSKHNTLPSMAVDIAFWNGEKLVWDAKQAAYLAGYIMATADSMGIKIRLGADWDRDGDITDENFLDLPHIELVE